MKKIKSVKKNGVSYTFDPSRNQWISPHNYAGVSEYLFEHTILSCGEEFDIEYEPERWRAKRGEIYEMVANDFNVFVCSENSTTSDDIRYESGNYFKPGKAHAFADFCKENILKFHEEKET